MLSIVFRVDSNLQVGHLQVASGQSCVSVRTALEKLKLMCSNRIGDLPNCVTEIQRE